MRIDDVAPLLDDLRRQRPLIHCITNDVTQGITANALLALGASPVMARDAAEVEEVTARAAALVINLGTPTPARIDASLKAVMLAGGLGLPWVFDPVGVAASALRRQAAVKLLAGGPHVVRGNAAEVAFLAGKTTAPAPGVDGGAAGVSAEEAAAALAALGPVAAVTAARDCIAGGGTTLTIANGVAMMTKVTGLGCCTTALIAAFLAVTDDAFAAAAAAVTLMGVAGERADRQARGPGSLAVALLDSLHEIGPADLVHAANWQPGRMPGVGRAAP